MPNWGTSGELNKDEVDADGALSAERTGRSRRNSAWRRCKAVWKVLVPVDKRPTKQMNKLDHRQFVLGHAARFRRSRADRRRQQEDRHDHQDRLCGPYLAHVGIGPLSVRHWPRRQDQPDRSVDGRPPQTVAEIKVGSEARSVETSKMKGWEDKYAIAGAYWPPQYVIMDGETLEPLKIVSTRGMTYDTQEYHPEPRVASIVASHFQPEFIVNVKETGQILLVDYSDIKNLKTTDIEAERFLHDGGFDSTGRYFLVAANARNKIAVIDTKEGKLVAVIETGGQTPHPGRGANFIHPKFGPVWATSHLGDETDRADRHRSGEASGPCLEGRADARRPRRRLAVRQVAPEVEASLCRYAAESRKPRFASSVAVFNIDDLDKDKPKFRVLPIGEWSGISEGQRRVVQGEYNKAGDEVWFSVWNGKDQESAIVVVDDKTLKLKTVIKDKRLITPTGKFNVFNTRNDIY